MTAVSAGCVVVSLSTRQDGVVARVGVTGEIDLTVEDALAGAVCQLGALAPRAVVIDLTDVTFAGTSLVNFLMRVRGVIPHDASMRTLGAIPLVRRVLAVTAVDQLVGLESADSTG
jgi:anti-anti-sigma factor